MALRFCFMSSAINLRLPEYDWYINNLGKGYFYAERFLASVDAWCNVKADTGGAGTHIFLKDNISNLESICFGEDFFPDVNNSDAVAQWLTDHDYAAADKALFAVMYKDWRAAPENAMIDDNRNGAGTNPAAEKYKQTDDWKISAECGVRTIFSLGLEPLLNDSSPCRVPPVPGKTQIDAFVEGVSGGIKEGGKVITTAGNELIFDTWKPLLYVGAVALIGILIAIHAKKNGVA